MSKIVSFLASEGMEENTARLVLVHKIAVPEFKPY